VRAYRHDDWGDLVKKLARFTTGVLVASFAALLTLALPANAVTDDVAEQATPRVIVTNVAVDLTVPTEPLPDTEPFQLRCAPEEAARRLEQVRDLGFDDTVLVLKNPTEAGLAAARALLR
jgi:hypothetical protein